MKHIEKKFLFEVKVSDEDRAAIEKNAIEQGWRVPFEDLNKRKKLPDNTFPLFTTHDNRIYKAFETKINNEYRIIPEPDPILVYFDVAYMNYIRLAEMKKNLLKLTNFKGGEDIVKELYDYFGTVSTVVIFLFTTLEATINRCIPEKYLYNRILPNKTETFNKQQIERYISFDEKIKKVIIEVTKKDFKRKYELKYNHIINLKNFRDDIIHTKSGKLSASTNQNYSKAFSFDFEKTIHAVKDFCNFYLGSELITDCSCSKDF